MTRSPEIFFTKVVTQEDMELSRLKKELAEVKMEGDILKVVFLTYRLIYHSDRGSQYCSYAYRDLLKSHNVIQSMSGKGNCYDN